MPEIKSWVVYALLGALFAAVTNVLSKPALDQLNVSLANTLRGLIMVAVLVGFTSVTGQWSGLASAPRRSLLLIGLAGLAAAASWLCGYQALKMTTVANSYPIDKLSVVFAVLLAVAFLGERPTVTNWVGIALVLAGGYLVTRSG